MVEICIVTLWEHFMGSSKLFRIVIVTADRAEARRLAAAEIRSELGIKFSARDIPMKNVKRLNLMHGSALIL